MSKSDHLSYLFIIGCYYSHLDLNSIKINWAAIEDLESQLEESNLAEMTIRIAAES